MFFIILVSLLTIISTWYYYRQYNTVWKYSELIPGRKALPLIGNAHQLGKNSVDYLNYMMDVWKEVGYRSFRVWIGPELYIIITEPEDLEVILSSNTLIDKFKDYRLFDDWIGQGLITSTGSHWFKHRRMLTPAFHFKILNDFHEIIVKGGNRLTKEFAKLADGKTDFDVQDLVNLSTLDVICETAMGVEINALDDPESELVKAFMDVSFILFGRLFSAWKRYDYLFKFSNDYKIHQKAIKILRDFNTEVIEKRRKILESQIVNGIDDTGDKINDDGTKKRRKAFLDILLTATIDDKPVPDADIADETSTFVFAGHDTTAAAIQFNLYHLSIHPAEQQKVYEEQRAIFGEDMDRDPSYQEIQEMKYLDMFYKESQRLIAAVPLIGRNIKEEFMLNGKVIPAGTSLSILIFAMGHNPKLYPEPHIFNPDRFLPDAIENKHPYQFVPFSAGPRNCIGQRFAVLELKTFLSTIVRKFEILPTIKKFEPQLAAAPALRSANGVYIRLRKRIP